MLGAAEVQDLLTRHGLTARRSLGQNFVADPNTVRKIARLAGVGPGDRVIEIGPGLGSLTLALAETGAQVVALEKDERLVPVLAEVLAGAAGPPGVASGGPLGTGQVRIVAADALTVDWGELTGPHRWTLVANLPYNVAMPVVMDVLERAPAVDRLVVMMQQEVAERLVADPGGRTIGIPSVKVGWYAEARILATVGPDVFIPRPRVMSSVLGITRRAAPSEHIGPAPVLALVEQAYRQRRKMLRSTLGRSVAAETWRVAGIEPTARPEELGVDDWVRLAEASARAADVRADGGAAEAP